MAQWIKANININFVGRAKAFITMSSVLIVVSVGALALNTVVRGSPLNFDTDFKGGSQIQVEFNRDVKPGDVRRALSRHGFEGAEVVRVKDPHRPYFYMLRMSEVTAFSPEQRTKVQQALGSAVGQKNLRRFDYKSGSDKVYLYFARKYAVNEQQIAKAFEKSTLKVQQIQRFGRAEDNVYEVILGGIDQDIRTLFDSELGKDVVKDVPQVESVGAKMGKQLRNDGIKSVVYALLLMLVYIAIRFDFRYAPGAVVALIHDVIITMGLFAISWQEFSLTTVAALLTIAGYSVNDTIVVYDRIRENVARLRDRKFPLVVNAALNETLSRTLLTSLTTLFTTITIWLVGTGVIKLFAFALTAGILVGTYSSLFIASPLVIYLNDKFVRKAPAR